MRSFVYDPAQGRFRDWLRTVTRNRVFKFLTRKDREGVGSGESLDELANRADAEWADDFQAQVLQVALERIQPQFEEATWRVFDQVWRQKRPAGETARELGLAIDLVYAAKSRVLKRLREEVLMLAEDIPHFVMLNE
jgi:RNA polymerase sigma-70 factor (ECF subfamily)